MLLVLRVSRTVAGLKPDLGRVKIPDGPLQAVTARGRGYDCVPLVFAAKAGGDEVPVTGSAHCMIEPRSCGRLLGKTRPNCFQATAGTGEPRRGPSDDCGKSRA